MADMTGGESIAEEWIAEAARTGQDWLDLGDLGLEKLPDALSKLTKLKRLSLGRAFQVNAEGMVARKRTGKKNSLSDISAVSSLSDLRELYLDQTNCNDLSPIAGLQQLKTLSCWGTQVSDLSPIAGLQQLQRLSCDTTKVSDLSPLIELINLTHISARHCKIRALPPEIGQLHGLELLGLEDNPLEDPLPGLIAPGQPQATINVLRWLRGEPIEAEAKEPDPPTPVEDADDPPAIPEQGAGPRVILDQTGRLVFARPSDLDAKGNDRNRLEALHPALREAAAELTKALQNHSSNLPNERLLQKAEAYRALVDLPLDEVNFARLYGAGMQLLNAAGATRRALEAGRTDVPDLTPIQDECLANIENLHPPFVLASREGQEMLADQTTIKLTAESVADVKEAGLEFGKELINNPDLADRNVGEITRDAAAEIGQGDNNTRDAVNAVATMRNAVIVVATASKWAIIPSIVGLAVGGPAGAVAAGGATLGWYLAKVAEKTKSFRTDTDNAANTWNSEADKMRIIRRRAEEHKKLLLKVEPKLRKITHLPGFTWLGSSLDWLKRNTPPEKKE